MLGDPRYQYAKAPISAFFRRSCWLLIGLLAATLPARREHRLILSKHSRRNSACQMWFSSFPRCNLSLFRHCTIHLTMNDEQRWKRELDGFIDKPKQKQRLSRPVTILLLVIALAVILFGGQSALSYWVDLLWFRSLGYGDVFWTTWRLQFGAFAIFAAATFLILYGTFLVLKRAHQADLPRDHEIIIAGQPVNLSVEPVLRIVAFCAALLIAFVTGTTMMD